MAQPVVPTSGSHPADHLRIVLHHLVRTDAVAHRPETQGRAMGRLLRIGEALPIRRAGHRGRGGGEALEAAEEKVEVGIGKCG